MPDLSFALDEDVSHRIAAPLRSRGLSVASAKELLRLGWKDGRLLLACAMAGQVLVTHNKRDFVTLHDAWHRWRANWSEEVFSALGVEVSLSAHAGIVILPHADDSSVLIRYVEEFDGFGLTSISMQDQLWELEPDRGWIHHPSS